MGTSAFRILNRTIHRIDFMRLCMGYSSPSIIHCSDCDDREECQRVWETEWWRGFCRHFLNPDKVLSPTAAAILLENAKIQNMCRSCLDATVTSIVASKLLNYRNNLIEEGVKDLLKVMHVQRENRIIRPASDHEQICVDDD